MAFELTIERTESRVDVALTGDLDIAAAPQLESELRHLEALGPRELVLDLRGLTFMDSTGLRLLIAADQRARKNDRVVTLVPGNASIQRLFDVTGVSSRLNFLDSGEGQTSS